jgi:hypothetical protein
MPKRVWALLLLLNLIPAYVQAKEILLESAHYKVYFLFLKVGEAQSSLYYNPDKKIFHAVSKAFTTGFVDRIYRVRDTMESYFKPSHFLRYRASIREGR